MRVREKKTTLGSTTKKEILKREKEKKQLSWTGKYDKF